MTVYRHPPGGDQDGPGRRSPEAARPAVEPVVCRDRPAPRDARPGATRCSASSPAPRPRPHAPGAVAHRDHGPRCSTDMEPRAARGAPRRWSLVHGDTSTSTAAALAAFYAEHPGRARRGRPAHGDDPLALPRGGQPAPDRAARRPAPRADRASQGATCCARRRRRRRDRHRQHRHRRVPGDRGPHRSAGVRRRAGEIDPSRPMIFVTAHRRENHPHGRDRPAMGEIAAFPVGPSCSGRSTRRRRSRRWPTASSTACRACGWSSRSTTPQTVAAVRASRFVLTDSGGLQEERRPWAAGLVMRRETERPEGLEAGTLRLIGSDYDHDRRGDAPPADSTPRPTAAWPHAANPVRRRPGRGADRRLARSTSCAAARGRRVPPGPAA